MEHQTHTSGPLVQNIIVALAETRVGQFGFGASLGPSECIVFVMHEVLLEDLASSLAASSLGAEAYYDTVPQPTETHDTQPDTVGRRQPWGSNETTSPEDSKGARSGSQHDEAHDNTTPEQSASQEEMECMSRQSNGRAAVETGSLPEPSGLPISYSPTMAGPTDGAKADTSSMHQERTAPPRRLEPEQDSGSAA
eukprot:817088-Amphidinium_carterae.1